jgi:hypothetical protein
MASGRRITGNPVEEAGLTGSQRYTISVPALPVEDGAATVPSGPMRFALVPGAGTGWDQHLILNVAPAQG